MATVTKAVWDLLAFIIKSPFKLAFLLVYPGKRKRLPPIDNELLLMPATELADKIRAKEVKAVDVVQAYIDRILAVNPLINAITDTRFDDALREAAALDASISAGSRTYSKEKYPFLGVPFTAKESIMMKGLVHACGIVYRKDVRATINAPPVESMIQAGGIPICLTNVPEACMSAECANRLYGRTNNPYDLDRTPGGSSGGEGALIASAGSVIGIGTDIAGSVRVPAFMTGIFCHKPTTGLVSNLGQFPEAPGPTDIDRLLVTGPLCRYAADLAPMFRVLAGTNVAKLTPLRTTDLASINIFYVEDGGSAMVSHVSAEIRRHYNDVIKHLEQTHRMAIHRIELPSLQHALSMWGATMQPIRTLTVAQAIGRGYQPESAFRELGKWLIGRSVHSFTPIMHMLIEKIRIPDKQVAHYTSMAESAKRELCTLLGDNGVLLCAPMPDCAPRHNELIFRPFDHAYCLLFNVFGLPSSHCPLGFGEQGLPIGIQIVGSQYNDLLTIHVAQELGRTFGGWIAP